MIIVDGSRFLPMIVELSSVSAHLPKLTIIECFHGFDLLFLCQHWNKLSIPCVDR